MNGITFFFEFCVWKCVCYVSIGQKSRRWRSTLMNWRRDLRRWGNAERLTISASSLWIVLSLTTKPLSLVLNVSTYLIPFQTLLVPQTPWLVEETSTTTFLNAQTYDFYLAHNKTDDKCPIGLYWYRDQIIMETWASMHLPSSIQSTIQNTSECIATSCRHCGEFCMHKKPHSYSFSSESVKKSLLPF